MRNSKKSDINEFIAMLDSEKDRIFAELDAEAPRRRLARSRPLNLEEQRLWRRFKEKMPRS